MTIQKRKRRFIAIVTVIIVAIFGVGTLFYTSRLAKKDSEVVAISEASTPAASADVNATAQPSFDKTKYSITDPVSIWFIVNKKNALDAAYQPAELIVPNVPLQAGKSEQEMSLRKDATQQLESMFVAAKEQGLQLKLASGYRSYDLQGYYYNSLVRSLGTEEANKVSAKPGTSEHQTGLAADIASYSNDICHLETCFATMPEGQWLAANAHTFGYIIRYPESKTDITGYNYEPWHVRYVGKELASELQKNNLTLEEFFGVAGQ